MKEEHLPLAKKYRPQTFQEFIGQETIIRILQNAINIKKLAHAFIFSGVRGVGKTTIARILAKAVNCSSFGSLPCGKCESCIAIRDGNHLDVYEIDAASKTGVDDIRDIIESVRYKPSMGVTKVYILDEVHMLSINAFNALLKTLEEPPLHVIFIFSTTEIHKVPTTIVSRCQRFDLFRVSYENLIAHFTNILNKENIFFDQEALEMIARASDGSIRDGLSILDQAIVLSSGNKIFAKDVENMLGLVDNFRVIHLMDALLEKNVQLVLEILENLLVRRGCDPNFLLHSLNVIIVDLAKADFIPNFYEKSYLSSEMKNFFNKWNGSYHFRQLSRIAQIFEKGMADLRFAYFPYELIYMTVMRVIYAIDLPFPDEAVVVTTTTTADSYNNQLKQTNIQQVNTRNDYSISERQKSFLYNDTFLFEKFLSAKSSQDVLDLLIELALCSNQEQLIHFLKYEAKLLEWKKGFLIFSKSDLLTDDFLQTIKGMLDKNQWIGCTDWHISCILKQEQSDINNNKIVNKGTDHDNCSSFIQELHKHLPNAEIVSVEDVA